MVSKYIYGAHAILLAYDITNYQVCRQAGASALVVSISLFCMNTITIAISYTCAHQSFQDLEDWMALVRNVYTQADMPYLAILANKADLSHMRTVRPVQHTDYADLHKMHR